ncbi:hypothetical protein DVA67_012755 [Solirubrobacter sp. CPCC 204708]|uniref:Uncharacterized protein n=1 Tax=Solirubrobacter deserti TaxID=2282478 RepID=A0ABT4RK56_9ACTN|nr:hypothetical protein [Solirubrobacter deserti]MBE2316846.1 hypothetical protein [Solirubrobacter deserti]MDA0138937.1 hypothetical protein [Solirubrobacter deserti]
MPEGNSFHAAARDMLGAAPEAVQADVPAAVAEWPLEGLAETRDRVRVAPGFYVRRDEGDDPPVYDEEGRVSLSYSNFVFDLAAAGRLKGQHLGAKGPIPGEAGLEWLAGRLKPGPVTATEALVIYRFYGPHEYATVRWGAEGDAEWHLEADSPAALQALRETVDRVGGVAPRGPASRLLRRRRKR